MSQKPTIQPPNHPPNERLTAPSPAAIFAHMGTLEKSLKRFRKRNGLSLRDLSAKAGVDHSHLSRIENGIQDLDTISFGVLKGIAKSLNVPVPVLVGDHGSSQLRKALSKATTDDLRAAEKLVNFKPGDARRKKIRGLLRETSR